MAQRKCTELDWMSAQKIREITGQKTRYESKSGMQKKKNILMIEQVHRRTLPQ